MTLLSPCLCHTIYSTIGSQAVINKLLPIDCLLHALQNNSSPRDKGLICQLISSLFVHHDFVFPSAALTEAQAKYCSINERDNAASTVTMGRLFNKYCLYQVREEPLNLRISLKEFVLKEIRTLSLADKSDQADDIAAYLFSLLSLLKGLLSIGFFEENFALNGKADDLGADIKFGEDYLGELLLSKLKELYADLHDIGSLKLGIQHTLEVQLKNGDISEEDQLSLIQRISKVNSGNLGAELASTVNRYFSVRFSHQITIDVVDSLMDLMVILMEIRGMNALKNILSALCHFDRVFPDIAKSTDLSCVDTDAVIPKFEKHFIKRNYPDDTARDIDEVETLFNAFYFDRKSLRKKILSFMQQRMFRSDLAKSTENIHFVASAEDSLGRRLFDTIGTTILKYSVEFEAFEHVPTKVAHIKETLSGLFDLLRDVLTNRHRDTIELTATSYSFLKSLKRFSTKQDVVYSPLEFEESDYFLLEYYDFFPSQVCDNAYYLKDLCIQLLRTIARLCRDDDEHDFLMDGSTEEERTCNAPLRKHGALPETSLYFIEMIFDLLAMVAGTDSRKLAIAWLPFAKVVQHFFGVFESVYIVLEVIYQFHPSLAALVNTDDLRFIRSALDKCVEAPATWPAILLRAILLNENDDPIRDLVRASVEDYFVSDSSETILRLAASSTQHPPLLLKAHAQILQLLIAVCKGSCSVTLKDRISTLFSIDYCIDFFDCRGFFLVSKSLLLQLLCARRIPLDERLLLSIQNILSKIYRFTEFCERESAQLLNDRWKNSFYDFSLVAVTGYIKTYLETFTRDFEYRISAMTATAHIPRSSLQMISDKITSILTYEASPLHHLPSPPSMKVYHTLGLIIDITMAGNGFLWKTLEADNAALQHMIWIGVTARYLISHSELPVEDRPLKAKIDAFLSHASGAHGIILLRNFRSKFLSNWGIRKYLNAVNIYLLARRTGTKNISKVNLTNNYDELRKSSLYAYELSEKTIRNSAPYAFFHKSFASIGKFVSMGGLPPEDEETGERDVSQRSSNSSRLDSLSDFDLWCACGGGLFELVAEYLIKYNFEEEASSDCDGSGAFGMPEMLFNTFCVLLTVRSSPNEKLSSSARNRLYAVQDAFDSFGLRVMVVKLLNKALLYSYESSYFSLLPAILRLGSLIMAEGNRACQNSFMKTIQGKTIGFVAPLRHILRECLQVYAHLQKDAPKAVDMRMLKIVNEVTGFVRNFCGGHNKEARVFLRSQPVLQSKVDLVFDLAEMIGLLGDILLHNYIRYIKYDFFREKLAPFVWNESSEARRQCIAWHDKSVDYLEVAQLLYSLGGFFRCLKDVVQGPCYENQQPLIKLSSLVLPLVEFCGVMHLRTKTKLPSKGFSENSFRLLRFEMSDPTKFLKVYRDELMRNGKLKEEPVWRHMSESQRAHEGSIGLDINLLLRVSKEAEVQCLQFALALLEGTSAGAVNELSSNVNYEILFQNMSSDFRSSSHSHLLHRRNGWREYSALRREASVCYLSLISTLFSATGHDTGMLARWIDKSKRKGIDINAFNASVEIVGSQGDIQQIYFTIPKHISQYWSYPEVQRSKEAIVYQNNRESPEEKINDFRDNIEVMLRVMARQRFLAYLLTPPLHALFGGKAFVPAWVLLIIPRPRVVILSIAIFLNFYYAYLTYRQVNPNFPGFDTYFQYLYDALNYELSVPTNFISFGIFTPLYVIKWLLFGLVGSVFIRNVLNSTAADRLLAADDDDNDYEDDKKRKSGVGLMIGKYLYISTFGFCLIILSEWWSISMCAFSLLAIFTSQWFYVPILLEVVPQFALMRFLVEAVRRNVFKILFTVIMFIILMYFFATISTFCHI